MNDVNEIKQGMKVRVVSDDGTNGMMIAEKHLSIRAVGKKGTVLNYVPGHGGDVWFVQQDNGIAAYCYTEIEKSGLTQRAADLLSRLAKWAGLAQPANR